MNKEIKFNGYEGVTSDYAFDNIVFEHKSKYYSYIQSDTVDVAFICKDDFDDIKDLLKSNCIVFHLSERSDSMKAFFKVMPELIWIGSTPLFIEIKGSRQYKDLVKKTLADISKEFPSLNSYPHSGKGYYTASSSIETFMYRYITAYVDQFDAILFTTQQKAFEMLYYHLKQSGYTIAMNMDGLEPPTTNKYNDARNSFNQQQQLF